MLGHTFILDMGKWGHVPCRVIEVTPHRKLAYTFDEFELHWTLLAKEDGCVLPLEHRGFDRTKPKHRFAFDNMGPGWRDLASPKHSPATTRIDF